MEKLLLAVDVRGSYLCAFLPIGFYHRVADEVGSVCGKYQATSLVGYHDDLLGISSDLASQNFTVF